MKKNTISLILAVSCVVSMGDPMFAKAEEQQSFSWKQETTLTNAITLSEGKEVKNLISVPVNQKIALQDIANGVSGVEASVMEVSEVSNTEYQPVQEGINVSDNTITVQKEGLSFVKVNVNNEEQIIAIDGLSSEELSDEEWKISQAIDKINMPEKLSDETIYATYNRYYDANSKVLKDEEYDKNSTIQSDGEHNKFLITNASTLENATKELKSYFAKGAFTIKSVKEISEYEGLKLTWSHKFKKNDIVAYDFMNNKQYSDTQKSVYENINIYENDGKLLHTAKVKVSLQTNENKFSFTKAMKKKGTYTVSVENGFGISKTYDFKWVYKNLKKRVYVKSGTHIYNATYQGKKIKKVKKCFNYYGQKKGSNGWIRVKYADGKYGYIKTKKITYKRLLPNRLVSKSDTKYSYNDMVKDLKQFKNYYSGVLTVEKYGKSEDDRNLYYVRMGNPKAKKRVLVQSTMHAREWLNTQMIMNVLEDYARGYYSKKYGGKTYKKLFNKVCFYVVPMYNPDGATISQYGPSKIRNAKLRSLVKKIGSYRRWKSNARGVDLNRNYNPGFIYGGHPSSEGYSGKKPYSESETRAMVKLVKTVKPQSILNYHEAGGIIYYNSGSSLLSTVRKVTGYGPTADHPKAHGNFGDWQEAKGYIHCTAETGSGTAPLPHSSFWGIYKKNKNVMAAIAKLYY